MGGSAGVWVSNKSMTKQMQGKMYAKATNGYVVACNFCAAMQTEVRRVIYTITNSDVPFHASRSRISPPQTSMSYSCIKRTNSGSVNVLLLKASIELSNDG